MAIWQFQCNIVSTRLNFDRLSRDEMISWKGVPQPPHNLKFLEPEDSWSKDIIQYGKSDETCIEFIYIDNILDEISCRLDLRSLTKNNLSFFNMSFMPICSASVPGSLPFFTPLASAQSFDILASSSIISLYISVALSMFNSSTTLFHAPQSFPNFQKHSKTPVLLFLKAYDISPAPEIENLHEFLFF